MQDKANTDARLSSEKTRSRSSTTRGRRRAALDKGLQLVPSQLGQAPLVTGHREDLRHILGHHASHRGHGAGLGPRPGQTGWRDRHRHRRDRLAGRPSLLDPRRSSTPVGGGEERKIDTLERFFNWFGAERAADLRVVCSDMWKAYLTLIRKRAGQALHVLDRFHVAGKRGEVIDKVRAAKARELKKQGKLPVLKRRRWLLLKHPEDPSEAQQLRLTDPLRLNFRAPSAPTCPRRTSSSSGSAPRPPEPTASCAAAAAKHHARGSTRCC